MRKLKEKLKNLPKKPGVYQFKDKTGGIIYIGKAKNLRARVAQYFGHNDTREQIPYLLAEAADLSYTVVNNELESLYLENTLIKQYLPKYNILLRDDKNYAFIKIDYSTQIPQIQIVRKVDPPLPSPPHQEEGNSRHSDAIRGLASRYFGPYSAAYKIRNTLNLVRRIFPYCSARKVSVRPCFYYYLHRCPGVCVGKMGLDEYKRQLQKIADFLSGNAAKIVKQLEGEMKIAARTKKFEAAARLRDQLNSLKLLREKQIAILPKKVDWDIVSAAFGQGYACVNLFKVRDGKLFDKENFVYESDANTRIHTKGANILQTFLEQYYLETSGIPGTIYAQHPIADAELVEHIVRSRFNKKIEVITPQKGKPLELVKLAVTNAEEYLKNWLSTAVGHLDKINNALTQLKEVLDLKKIPERIEGYDISNIQGTNAVGSMVVFEKGLPRKNNYRKFKITTKSTPDDFAMIKEMLERRFAHSVIARSASGEAIPSKKRLPPPSDVLGARNDKNRWPMPDLIVIDGGKGQLNAALKTIKDSQLTIPAIGLAKRIEEIFIPGQKKSVILFHDQPALQLLQRLRDEAHRFGITFHRKLRSQQAVRSALDDISGIGPKTKKLLKAKFGSVANIRKAGLDDLAAVVGERIARLIQQSL